MNISIIYSSVTGNTEKLARGIQAIFSHHTHISSIEQAPLSHDADLYILGFWVRRGAPDSRMARYMRTLHGKNVAYFGTLGAYPDSPHAQKVITAANALLEGNTILGSFLCQGKIHPSLTGPLPGTVAEAPIGPPMVPQTNFPADAIDGPLAGAPADALAGASAGFPADAPAGPLTTPLGTLLGTPLAVTLPDSLASPLPNSLANLLAAPSSNTQAGLRPAPSAGAMHTNKKLRSSHPMTPERLARHKEAAKHPNAEDIQKAQEYFREIVERMER